MPEQPGLRMCLFRAISGSGSEREKLPVEDAVLSWWGSCGSWAFLAFYPFFLAACGAVGSLLRLGWAHGFVSSSGPKLLGNTSLERDDGFFCMLQDSKLYLR